MAPRVGKAKLSEMQLNSKVRLACVKPMEMD